MAGRATSSFSSGLRFGSQIAEPLSIAETIRSINWTAIPERKQDHPRPIFVVGAPRSGTTLVGACVSNACGYAVRPQSLFLLDIWSIFANLHQGANRRQTSSLGSYIGVHEVVESLGRLADDVMMGRVPAGRAVDHTPWYGAIIPLLTRLFPGAQFIHVIRNGRFVSESLRLSYRSGFSWAGEHLSDRLSVWQDMVGTTMSNARFLDKDSYLEVRYEALCAAPMHELELMFNFLKIDNWEKPALSELAIAHASPARADSLLGDVASGDVTVTPRRQSSAPEGWSREDEAIFVEHCGELAKKLGY